MSVKTRPARSRSKALAPPVVSAVKPDGGPAFPKAAARLHGGGIDFPNSGMSLRVWLAGQSLPLVAHRMDKVGANWTPPVIANIAFEEESTS